jgi:acyl carrier protein phosphodiesterase
MIDAWHNIGHVAMHTLSMFPSHILRNKHAASTQGLQEVVIMMQTVCHVRHPTGMSIPRHIHVVGYMYTSIWLCNAQDRNFTRAECLSKSANRAFDLYEAITIIGIINVYADDLCRTFCDIAALYALCMQLRCCRKANERSAARLVAEMLRSKML